MPGTRALKIFEAAGRHLNFTRAAEEVGLTPAAVSYQIKEIEDQLGIVLFARTSRSIRLTPAGGVLFEAVGEALDGLQRAVSRASRSQRALGQLCVSLGARFATNWMLPRLSAFQVAHPRLKLRFDITDEIRDFEVDDIDLAIRFGDGNFDGLNSVRLFDTVMVAVCSPRLLEAGQHFTMPADLIGHTLCYRDWRRGDLTWPDWRMWMQAAGVDTFDDSACVAFADTSHVVQAVLDSGAIGLADLAMIANDIAEGRLVRLFNIEVPVAGNQTYHLVYPHDRSEDPAILAFRDWMLAAIEAQQQGSG
ncbi:LysR substrate-binding domain-containing protein [Labrys sp. (in: a-proteobacteria)]|uniref:LysR substrate-binding domain-containing protein n=1 Tax=Labrys sp. (in: a-proteobacteria) TaxID=1917972 RepID=UPI0039E68EDA